jgi:hypothetical protein
MHDFHGVGTTSSEGEANRLAGFSSAFNGASNERKNVTAAIRAISINISFCITFSGNNISVQQTAEVMIKA